MALLTRGRYLALLTTEPRWRHWMASISRSVHRWRHLLRINIGRVSFPERQSYMNVILKMPIYPQTLVNQCCKSKNMFDKVSLAQHSVRCIVAFLVRRNSTRFVASGFQFEPTNLILIFDNYLLHRLFLRNRRI